jgi:hypothetical protein
LCQAYVVWAVTEANGKPLPLNPRPDPAGNQAAFRDGLGVMRTRQLKDGDEPYKHEKRYMPHFATCAKRDKPHLAVVPPPNVTPITAAPSLRGGTALNSPARRRGTGRRNRR